MAGSLNAKIIMARCSKNKKVFGIRVEQRGKDWIRTWAFPMDGDKAKREGFETNTVTGSMSQDDNYPGCPHCGSAGFVQCFCGKIGCNGGVEKHGKSEKYVCPWCNEESELKDADSFDISGGGY